MMYWGFPSVNEADRLARAPALDAGQVTLTPQAAARTLRLDPRRPDRMRLTTVDGRPAYRGGRVVYADTGRVQGDVSTNMRDRAAEAWTGQRVRDGVVESVIEVDQWTVQGALRNRRPLWKYSWPNGEQLYIGDTGEVLQYTTTASRWGAWVSAIPHRIYFTAIRQHQTVWIRFVIWTSGIGTVLAIIGLVVAVARYSPGRRYRQEGRPARLPYRGQQRWHAILGLIFGVATDPLPHRSGDRPCGRAVQQPPLGQPLALQRPALAQLSVALQQPPPLGHRRNHLHAGRNRAVRDLARALVARGRPDAPAVPPLPRGTSTSCA